MSDTKSTTPAAASKGRARSKAAANGEKVAAMNTAAAEPTRTDLIKTATGLGVKGASAMNKLELKRSIGAAQTKGIVDAVVESAKNGPNAEATKAAGKSIAEAVKAAPSPTPAASTDRVARRSKRGPRGEEAREMAAKLGKRGPGRKVTDDELAAYVASVRKAHPETSASDELEYAYWIEKLAVNRDRFNRAWAGKASKAA